jgi:hypothetical protein
VLCDHHLYASDKNRASHRRNAYNDDSSDRQGASVEKFDCMDQKIDFVYLIERCNQTALPTADHRISL